MPMYAALKVFDADDFDSWIATQALEQLLPHTGCLAMVTYCPTCVSFASVSLDGIPCDVTVTL